MNTGDKEFGIRIRHLRKKLELTQSDFAARIGLTQNTITKYENGFRGMSNQILVSICREFNVNEEWLRYGTGEMFISMDPDEEVAYMIGSILPNASDFVKNTLIALGKLSREFTEEDWSVIDKFIKTLAEDHLHRDNDKDN